MENMNEMMIFNPELGVAKTETFSKVYPVINEYIMNNQEWIESRDGKVKEILDFKTQILNPYRRLVGGKERNENPFFLLAEAMWIFTGRKDVRFLTLFNSNMKNFSDDGKVFHAPYGFRLRHWGVRSEDKFCEENLHAAQGYDQVADAVKIFDNNPNTRQVVLSIWNPDLDLGTKTKDIPCNDILMLKIRNGKLISTIQNRSNDLHWGLPTNVFQFSFITEMIASCLGIELGTQTHNSQSLHVYEWNNIATTMLNSEVDTDLYEIAQERKIDFNFAHDVASNRLREIDYHLNVVIDNLERIANGMEENPEEVKDLGEFSQYLEMVYLLLKVYLNYKIACSKDKTNRVNNAHLAIDAIENVSSDEWLSWDVNVLARNWFAKKVAENNTVLYGKL